jgi:hypothetical protein
LPNRCSMSNARAPPSVPMKSISAGCIDACGSARLGDVHLERVIEPAVSTTRRRPRSRFRPRCCLPPTRRSASTAWCRNRNSCEIGQCDIDVPVSAKRSSSASSQWTRCARRCACQQTLTTRPSIGQELPVACPGRVDLIGLPS